MVMRFVRFVMRHRRWFVVPAVCLLALEAVVLVIAIVAAFRHTRRARREATLTLSMDGSSQPSQVIQPACIAGPKQTGRRASQNYGRFFPRRIRLGRGVPTPGSSPLLFTCRLRYVPSSRVSPSPFRLGRPARSMPWRGRSTHSPTRLSTRAGSWTKLRPSVTACRRRPTPQSS